MTSVPATVADPTAKLADWMDITHGVGLWAYRGGVDAGTDAGEAINAALRALNARYYKGGTVLVEPSYVFQISRDIEPDLLSGNFVVGAGEEASFLCFGPGTTRGFWFSGSNGRTGGGLRNIQYLIEASAGDSLKTPLLLQGDEHFQPDDCHFENVRCGSMDPTSAFWYNGPYFNGMLRDPSRPNAPGGSLQGIRVGTIKNWQQFCCRNAGALLYNVVQFGVENFGIYSHKPGTAGGTMYLGGAGTWGSNTTQLRIEQLTCGGDLVLGNCSKLFVDGQAARVVAYPSCDLISGTIYANEPMIGTLGPHASQFRVISP
jgi:hypothetical protein